MFRPPYRVSARRRSARARWLPLVLALVAAMITSCASFPDTGPRQWRDKPEDGGPLAAPPRVPENAPESEREQPPSQPGQAVPNGCVDPDPQVVATCLSPLSAVAVLPDPESALVAERASGRILRVQKGKEPQVVATVPVDPAGGGLIGLVLSPSYVDDQLLYALAATGSDRRVLRIAPGDPPTPVLTGIPRAGDDSGALGVGKDGALLVATGGSGGLGGKLLRIDTFGHPFKDNPDPRSPVYSTGLRSPSGLCTAPDSGTVWVTDRFPERDVLHRITPGQLGDPAWSWPDRPGVAGCVAPPGALAIAERGASALFLLRMSAPTAFTGTPQQTLGGAYGRLGPTALAPDGLIWLGTTNKGAGGPTVSSDDRAIRIQPPSGGGGSGPD
ncbi:PQQ-dependent sugar dehydrogenase [Pseudonocardia acaciae]|uniref:PQQ-dependent sugar dehydrogenase n=1 Tax=Pseudonocardia acaciae TaxID=551276 RepID=UPI000B1B205E|nr:PQQ-dependent sugar dehydrogenase [Pseudonocardia acaciae]